MSFPRPTGVELSQHYQTASGLASQMMLDMARVDDVTTPRQSLSHWKWLVLIVKQH